MVAFGKYHNPVAVLHDPESVREGLIILFQVLKAVPDPEYRQHLEAVQDACDEFLFEYVCPGKKYQLSLEGADDRQWHP